MEAPHQSITQMKEEQKTSRGRSNPAHSTSGIKRKLGMAQGMAPQVVAVKQSDVQTKASSMFCLRNRVMGEAAKNLSPEKMAALEIDIFKPLDFYEILFNKLKGSDKGRIINNINEL